MDGAASARDQGDVFTLVEAIGGVPFGLRTLLLRDEQLVGLAARLEAQDEDDPLIRIHGALQRLDHATALIDAATHLRVEGSQADPLVLRFLLSAFEGLGAGTQFEARTQTQLLATVLVARLFYERPVTFDGEREFFEPLRQAVLARIRADEADDPARLYLWTALAACGLPEDLQIVCARMEQFEEPREELALTFRAAEWIIRRAHALGRTGEIDFERCWRAYGRWIADWKRLDTLQYGGRVERALGELHAATAYAYRAAVDSGPGAPVFCGEWLATLDFAGNANQRDWMPIAAAFQAPAFRVAVEGAHFDEIASTAIGWLLKACVVAGDAAGLERATAWGLQHGHSSSELEKWRTDAELELRGVKPEFDPSPETLLGVEHDCESLDDLPTRWTSDATAFRSVHSVQSLPPSSFFPRADPRTPDELPFAFWNFRDSPPAIGGSATVARVRCASLSNDASDYQHLRLNAFGHSELELVFEHEFDPNEQDRFVSLVLHHLSNARAYYPHEGDVRLHIRVNDEVIEERLLFFNSHGAETWLDLPPGRIVSGENSISIRLHETTTTTHQLHAVELRRRQR